MSQTVTQTESSGIPTADELGFDPGALREKYAAERTKRLRADANNQYREISGQFAHYNEDHYVESGSSFWPSSAISVSSRPVWRRSGAPTKMRSGS